MNHNGNLWIMTLTKSICLKDHIIILMLLGTLTINILRFNNILYARALKYPYCHTLILYSKTTFSSSCQLHLLSGLTLPSVHHSYLSVSREKGVGLCHNFTISYLSVSREKGVGLCHNFTIQVSAAGNKCGII